MICFESWELMDAYKNIYLNKYIMIKKFLLSLLLLLFMVQQHGINYKENYIVDKVLMLNIRGGQV